MKYDSLAIEVQASHGNAVLLALTTAAMTSAFIPGYGAGLTLSLKKQWEWMLYLGPKIWRNVWKPSFSPSEYGLNMFFWLLEVLAAELVKATLAPVAPEQFLPSYPYG